MNKKLFALPLTVAAMGLASCNKSWPTITDDKSKEIVNNILNKDEIKKMLSSDYSGLNNVLTIKKSTEEKTTEAGKVTSKGTSTEEITLNVDKNYEHEIGTDESLSSSSKDNDYYIFKDGMGYELYKLNLKGYKTSATESNYKEYIKRRAYRKYISFDTGCGQVYKLMQTWDSKIAEFKTAYDTYKDNKDYYFNYELRSNDSVDSIQLIVDGKTPKGIVDPTDNAIYQIEKINATIVHGLVTSYYFEEEYKYKEDDVEKIEYTKTNQTYTFGSASVDNINLDDYYIEAY